MPRTYTSLMLAFSTLAAAACHDEPVRPVGSPPREAERTIARTIDGKAVRVRYDGRTATISVDGRPTMQVRYDGELRHVTAVFADGRAFRRTYTRRELAEVAGRVPRPSLDEVDGGEDSGGCTKQWVTFAGAALVAVVTCESTGPTPACASAVAATAVALEAVIACEKQSKTPSI